MRRLAQAQEVVLTTDSGAAVAAQVVGVGRNRAWLRAESVAAGLTARGWLERRVLMAFQTTRGMVALQGELEFGEGSRDLRFVPADGEQMSERRVDPRVAVAVPVRLVAGGTGEEHDATTLDISRGGMRIRHQGLLRENDTYRVELVLPEDEPSMTLTAKPVFTAPSETRLAFVELEAPQTERLGAWVLRRLRLAAWRGRSHL